ncbi:LysR family transcriptional regulator [Croceicoccus gelatinilyticus]|uniref:LysR family transcriptional regulator n=1 Tax=Croceicoccus gelatinilyticus TaxID=2835536 RepID=UPI001BCF103D|nr:LysR family transcriptional regulator [Croceicoccus gelatinilyticus]MBS7669436.1 LysR family transcriptional regulator [Croceicoccus gelatinilyticus]
MNWNDLQDFLAIARAGKLASAAEASGVDPTTMGRRLRRLERSLGQRLFEQTREGQVMTEAGEALMVRAEAMERAASGIGQPSTGHGESVTGTLRLALPEGFASSFLPYYLEEFAEAHPRLVTDLAVTPGLLSPTKREADLAIVLSRPRSGPLIAGKLTDYALRLYASRDYLARHGTPKKPADLAQGHRLVGYVPDLLHMPELRHMDRLHPGLEPTLRSSSINAQHNLVVAGAGLGVLHCFAADRDTNLVPVFPTERITRTYWLVTHRDTHQLERVQVFRNWLLRLVKRERTTLLPE